MMHHRHRGGAYMEWRGALQPAHFVQTKWKPWQRALNYVPFSRDPTGACSLENLVRQAFMRGAGLDRGRSSSACAVAFRAAAAELDASLNRTSCCSSLGNPPVGTIWGALTGEGVAGGFGAVELRVF